MRPRGRPPTPSARSRPGDPVEMTLSGPSVHSPSPSNMSAPLPNCFSTTAMACFNAFIRSSSIASPYLVMVLPIAERLGQNGLVNLRLGREVGDAARDAQRAIDGAARQKQGLLRA